MLLSTLYVDEKNLTGHLCFTFLYSYSTRPYVSFTWAWHKCRWVGNCNCYSCKFFFKRSSLKYKIYVYTCKLYVCMFILLQIMKYTIVVWTKKLDTWRQRVKRIHEISKWQRRVGEIGETWLWVWHFTLVECQYSVMVRRRLEDPISFNFRIQMFTVLTIQPYLHL